MRALLRPLSVHTVFSPIETIVLVFVFSTLAYFHILDGIKHSSFFAPTIPSTLRPAHVRLVGSDWTASSEREWFGAWKDGRNVLELQQISFVLDDKTKQVSVSFYPCAPFYAGVVGIHHGYVFWPGENCVGSCANFINGGTSAAAISSRTSSRIYLQQAEI